MLIKLGETIQRPAAAACSILKLFIAQYAIIIQPKIAHVVILIHMTIILHCFSIIVFIGW